MRPCIPERGSGVTCPLLVTAPPSLTFITLTTFMTQAQVNQGVFLIIFGASVSDCRRWFQETPTYYYRSIPPPLQARIYSRCVFKKNIECCTSYVSIHYDTNFPSTTVHHYHHHHHPSSCTYVMFHASVTPPVLITNTHMIIRILQYIYLYLQPLPSVTHFCIDHSPTQHCHAHPSRLMHSAP